MATRFSQENCDSMCAGDHLAVEHDKQGWYTTFKKQQLGEQRYMLLEQKARSTMKRREAIMECMFLILGTKEWKS